VTIPLHADAVFTGKPTSVAATTLTFSGVNWATNPSQFGATPANHILRVLSGQQAGRILHIVSNSSNSVTVSITDRTLQSTALNTSGFAVTSSDTVEIVPCDTLAGIFGDSTPSNPLLIVGGTSLFTADTVSIADPTSGKALSYFFNTSVNQWRRSGSTANFNSLPIYPDDALGVLRRTNRSASQLVLTGRVPSVSPIIKCPPGSGFFTTLGVPVDVRLRDLVLTAPWTKSNSLFTADTISLYNATQGRFYPYFQRTDNSWRASASSSAPDVSSTVIPAGSVIGTLERSTNLTGPNSFLRVPLPYTL
jgi:uncharacterized protein (TIGR02597 family)